MAFEILVPAIDALKDRKLVHDVTIVRRLYSHSEARVVIDWDEKLLEGDKKSAGLHPTANLGAALLNSEVTINWRGRDLAPNVECFKGYITGVSASHTGTRSLVTVSCISKSRRADIIPRYRVFQQCTLLDICQHIAGKESIFQVQSDASSVLGGITIDLSAQYEETDFAYLGRMLHAWGIPMFVDDRLGKVGIGGPTATAKGSFPAVNWHCDAIMLQAELVGLDGKSRNPGSGATGAAKSGLKDFNASLVQDAAGYLPRLDDDHLQDQEWISERVFDSIHQAHAAYRVDWHGTVFDYSPGVGVKFADQSFLIRESIIRGDPSCDDCRQEVVLQDYMAPLQLYARRVPWPSRMFWAKVTKNTDEDPTRQGRMQVEFDWEKLDPTVKGDKRAWLPTVTPYGGLKGKSGTSGFISLPEVGERVLVQFLGDWDSDAVIMGSVREYARDGYKYQPHLTKRWQTPSGNQITLSTMKDGTDIVRIKCQDKLIFKGKLESSKQTVVMDLMDSKKDRIHFQGGSGPTRLDIFCSGEIYMHAENKLLLEGGQVQIKSTTGNINIDGSPMVKINCGPWSLSPLTLDPDQEDEGSASQQASKAKPPTWTAMVSPTPTSTEEEKLHFIEHVLKDEETGEPIPNERYKLKLPDGSIQEGRTDSNGRVRVEGIPAGQTQISYPDIDADSWKPV
jgi:hypothetical protein